MKRLFHSFGKLPFILFGGTLAFGLLGVVFALKYDHTLAVLSIILAAILWVVAYLMIRYKGKKIPVQKEWASVVDKKESVFEDDGCRYITTIISFEFPDGSGVTAHLLPKHIRPARNPDCIALNDTGIVLYETWKDQNYFIGFERDDGSDFYLYTYYRK